MTNLENLTSAQSTSIDEEKYKNNLNKITWTTNELQQAWAVLLFFNLGKNLTVKCESLQEEKEREKPLDGKQSSWS